MRTSSSVDPDAVCGYRAQLFDTLMSPASWQAQDAFHAWSEPDRPGSGIAMSRADACTVSLTTIEVFAEKVRMAYRPMPGPAVAHVTELARAT
jgi:hypothetical protein